MTGGVKKWRTFKNKGESCKFEGTTFWWCPKHKHPHGYFDDLYCTHKHEDHDEWKAGRRERNKRKAEAGGTGAAPSNSSKPDASKKLAINQRLK